MEKITINGEQYIKLRTLLHAMLYLRRAIPVMYNQFSREAQFTAHDAIHALDKEIFKEEYALASTPEDYRAIHEIPGDYLVYHRQEDGKMEFFQAWTGADGWAGTPRYHEAMVFNYLSKAEEVADDLNAMEDIGWKPLNMSPELSHKLIPEVYPKRDLTDEQKQKLLDILMTGDSEDSPNEAKEAPEEPEAES